VTTDRRLRTGEAPTGMMLAVWLVVTGMFLVLKWQDILVRELPDPDDSLRLVQLRDLLGGQGWFDLHQYRVAPPDGVLMHWSRIVDAPPLLIIGTLRPFIGQWWAEQAALLLIPAALFLVLVLVIGRMSWRLLGREAAIFAVLSLAMLPLVLAQFQPLRIDHHSYQVVAFALAAWALSWRNPMQGALVAGAAMATGTMISLEMLPFAAIIAVILLGRWLCDHRERQQLTAYLQTYAATLVLLFLITRGLGDVAAHCDVVTPVHLGFFLVTALGTGLVAGRGPLPPAFVLGGLGLTGMLAAGFFAWNAPQCVGSPFGGLDPIVHDYWYLRVLEGNPVWRASAPVVLVSLPHLLLGCAASILLALRGNQWLRRWWFEVAVMIALGAVAGILTTRSLSIIAPLAAVPVGWLAAELFRWWTKVKRPLPKLAGAAAITIVLVPATLVVAAPLIAGSPEKPRTGLAESACYDPDMLARLDRLEPAMIVAPMDLGPLILERTRHSVLATGHHRGNAAMATLIGAQLATPERARRELGAYPARYLLFCDTIAEARIYSKDEGSLAAALRDDRPPAWLSPVNAGLTPEARLYRIERGPAEPGPALTLAGSRAPPR
jgi:hypothetical protein